MADVAASGLTYRDRHFALLLFGACALFITFVSLIENDRRGLLRWDRPGVFASGDVTPLSDSYDIIYLGIGQKRGLDPLYERRAARLIPLRDGMSDIATPGGAGPQTTTVAPSVPAVPGQANGSPDIPLARNSNPPTQGRTPFTPSNLGGGGVSPPGVIVVDTPPVVPAVPEPAAWLLMILGVAILAGALRRRAVVEHGSDSECLVGLARQVG